jgi:hypothetical protein
MLEPGPPFAFGCVANCKDDLAADPDKYLKQECLEAERRRRSAAAALLPGQATGIG